VSGEYFGKSLKKIHVLNHKTNKISTRVYIYEHMKNYIKFDVIIERDEFIVEHITDLAKKGINI
jgi:hypothetical protein